MQFHQTNFPGQHSPQSTSWERSLLAKASAALDEQVYHLLYPAQDNAQRRMAYAYCQEITRRNSRTFYMATALMPAPKRRAIRSLYALCRVTDDVVDEAVGDRSALLLKWRKQIFGSETVHEAPVLIAWSDTRHRYNIPVLYVEQLLDGIAQDLIVNRYASFEELAHYCYGVASTVGLMSMHIIGYSGPEAISYAVKLGVALQLTNILRDVGEDWRQGRLYLPQDELAAYGLDEEDLDAGRVDDRWRDFMRFQIARARRLYVESLPGVALLHRDGRFAVAAAAELYREILDDIEAHDYDVFNRRAHLSDARKLARLPGIAWRSYTNRYAKLFAGQ
jgi:phytoene synthase